MSQYHTFTAHDAVAYAQQFAGIDNPSELVSAQEVGDGNLNLVFKVFDRQGVSRAIVKQALPYVRCVGESWPLTLDRARLEAQTLVAHYQHSPQHTVKIHHFDPELAVMVMEDLSDHRIWRGELIANVYYPQAARQLGDYLAQVLFHTSDFYLHPHEKKAQVAQFINPAMCEITEDLFFNDPYQIHERNNYPAELEADVAALRDDAQLKLAVAALKHRFFAHAEALLHGDIHSGSIFVAEGSLKAIDAEFGYFGPIGFDIGTAIGNLLLNYCGLPGQLGIRDAAAAREQRLNDIHQLWTTFAERFQALVTGASRGLGRAIALSLARAGADVVITYEKSVDKAQAVADEIKALGRYGEAVQADSASAQAIQDAVTHAARSLGGLDILVNNAGIARGGPLESMTLADIDALINVNIRGVVIATQEALVHMADGGRIINIGSCLANRVAMPGISVYAMTKSALNALTRGLARDLGPRGITVNLVHPGPTNSDMNPEDGEQAEAQRQMIAVGHYGQPEDIAAAVTFLASPAAGQISGTGLDVDGGLNA
ncbi:TPA: S-methyl-5-thioribose kinase [Klebsiella pneumoniae]|nr:S-methyl-5-thioribose kinase [Klebsiella pneumoniae]